MAIGLSSILLSSARHHAGHVLDDRPVGGAQLGVMDPGAVGDLAAVLRGVQVLVDVVDRVVTVEVADLVVIHVPELVLVGIVVVAALVVREGNPVQQLLERLVGDVAVLVGVVVADAGGVDLQQRRGVDDREVVGAREAQFLLVRLIRGEEREDRELVGVLEQAQRILVLGLVPVLTLGGHQPHGVRVVVVILLVLGEGAVAQPLVLDEVGLGVPQLSSTSCWIWSAVCCIASAFS